MLFAKWRPFCFGLNVTKRDDMKQMHNLWNVLYKDVIEEGNILDVKHLSTECLT